MKDRKIIEYDLIVQFSVDEFTDRVNYMIKNGWHIKDNSWSEIGPETNKYQGRTVFYQAMVKYEQ